MAKPFTPSFADRIAALRKEYQDLTRTALDTKMSRGERAELAVDLSCLAEDAGRLGRRLTRALNPSDVEL